MSKVLDATCENGEVTAEGIAVEGVEILSEGVGASSGIIILDEDKGTYIPKTSPDLKDTLEQVIEALNQVVTVFTSIGAGMTGPTTAPPPTLATDLLVITNAATALETLKGQLR